jgi:hypothetical protein
MSDETNCETGQLQAGAVGAEHGPGATLRDAMTGSTPTVLHGRRTA